MRIGRFVVFCAATVVPLAVSSCIAKDNGAVEDGVGGSDDSHGSVVNIRGGSADKILTSPSEGSAPSGSTTSTLPSEPCPNLLADVKKTDSSHVCSQSKQEAILSKINVLIVLDKSGSMNSTPEGYTKTKWTEAIDALKKSLDPNSDLISYGIALYPFDASVTTPSCEVATGDAAVNVKVGPAVSTVPEIIQLMESNTPAGGTPTAAALGAAYEYYTQGSGLALEGAKYVLLVTDGGPNCNADISCDVNTCTAYMDKAPNMSSCWNGGIANCCDRATQVPGGVDPQTLCLDELSVTAQLDSLRASGIHTFVIGIPGAEVYAPYLDGFAESGGEPVVGKLRKYYEVTGESGLADAFKTITTKLVNSCTVLLDEAPLDTTLINVAINCKVLPPKTGDQRNWTYDGPSRSIVIEGTQCEMIRTVGVNRIDVVNGCPTVDIW